MCKVRVAAKWIRMTNESTQKLNGRSLDARYYGSQTKCERKMRIGNSSTYFPAIATPPRHNANQARLSPRFNGFVKSTSAPSTPSPSTSPTTLINLFAGGKWCEPPSPLDLPRPPTQWTGLKKIAVPSTRCRSNTINGINHQMMLGVQA